MVLRKVITPQPPRNPISQLPTNSPNHAPNSKDENKKQPKDFLPVPNPMTSYWLRSPHRYAHLRTTPSLPTSCDIAIIGSGMAGILTCYHILRLSQTAHTSNGYPLPRIVLLDARDLCSGATARNGGHSKVKTATLARLADSKERNAWMQYQLATHDELKALVDTHPGLASASEFELRRSFDVWQDEKEFGDVKSVYDDDAAKGEAWTKKVAEVPRSYVERVTSIRDAVGAFSVPVASFWPYRLVTGVLEDMVERYATEVLNVQMNTVVTRLSSSSSSSAESMVEEDKHTSILETPRGTLLARKVVLATNAYTASLLPCYSKTIIPYKGMNSHHTPVPRAPSTSTTQEKSILPQLSNTYNIHFSPSSPGHPTGCDYLNPRPDGGIVVGGGSWMFQRQQHENSHLDPSSSFPSPSSSHSTATTSFSDNDKDRYKWYNTVDDSVSTGHFPKDVYAHWTHYMASTFLYRSPPHCSPPPHHYHKEEVEEPDHIWTGIQGATKDGLPHVGRVPNFSLVSPPPPPPPPHSLHEGQEDKEEKKKQKIWLLAGFNGGGMSLIPLAAKAVAKMVVADLDFEDVKEEFGLLEGMGTGVGRMVRMIGGRLEGDEMVG